MAKLKERGDEMRKISKKNRCFFDQTKENVFLRLSFLPFFLRLNTVVFCKVSIFCKLELVYLNSISYI